MMHRNRHFSRTMYHDRHINRRVVRILPGEYHATDQDAVMSTVLGSCVSVCLHDPRNRVGGMNHFMLPGRGLNQAEQDAESPRYGSHAMDLLIRHLIELGGDAAGFEAKVFGAGRVMQAMTDIGRHNADFAIRYLESKKIRVAAVDVGDIYPRKIFFESATGKVLVRKLREQMPDQETLHL